MAQIDQQYRRFVPQILHAVALPIFYFIFMLTYRPMNVVDYLGNEWFAVHLTISSCIIFL